MLTFMRFFRLEMRECLSTVMSSILPTLSVCSEKLPNRSARHIALKLTHGGFKHNIEQRTDGCFEGLINLVLTGIRNKSSPLVLLWLF